SALTNISKGSLTSFSLYSFQSLSAKVGQCKFVALIIKIVISNKFDHLVQLMQQSTAQGRFLSANVGTLTTLMQTLYST
ncbi:MAG: hypothetical protein QXT35_05800, partial [Conexivisphaerales archaeon]